MHAVRLLWTYFRLGALKELQYRANAVLQLAQSLLGLGTALASLSVIYAHTRRLDGWRPSELLAVVGVYFLIGGLVNMVIQPSMQHLMEEVRLGTFDHTLTKPVDAQLLTSVKQVQIWKAIDIVMALVILVVAVVQLGGEFGVAQALGFVVALLAGGATVYSFLLILATCTFWFVRVDNVLVVFQSMYEAGKWPVGIYPPWLRVALTFIVPVAVATTVPAEGLTNRLGGLTLPGAVAFAAVLVVASRVFWRVGIRRYAGASA